MSAKGALRWDAKSPVERDLFEVSFDKLLRGDTIVGQASVSVPEGDGALSIDGHFVEGRAVIISISGGTLDTDYEVVVTVNATSDRIISQRVSLAVIH